MSAIAAYIGPEKIDTNARNIIRQWFWCGILGEMYGGANETRYANDIEDVVDAIEGRESQKRTVNAAYFHPTRLLGLQTRKSAAYKGVMALILQEKPEDFIEGFQMTTETALSDVAPDIHHIFPKKYCQDNHLDERKWNSVVNKTPLIARTNRVIGSSAPSEYLVKVQQKGQIDERELQGRIESHCINYDLLAADDFDGFFVDRAKRLLDLIGKAVGRQVSDRSSPETIEAFGASLE